MSSLASFLPEQPGLLPKWILFISAVSLLNGISALRLPIGARRVYAYTETPVTAHSARVFGTYTIVSGIVRAYTAYDLQHRTSYVLALWTFLVAMGHFGMEGLVFKTTGLRTAAFPTYVVSIVSVVWMWLQWDYYVQ